LTRNIQFLLSTHKLLCQLIAYICFVLIKKYIAILFLSVAYSILLGHNIVPHHHHDHEHEITESHHSHEHDNNDDDESHNDLSHLFSHLIHSADGISFITTHNITNTFSKQQLSLVAILPDNFLQNDFLIPPLLQKPPAEHLVYISPHALIYGLRAPPSL
jgi:hypothetical protein